MVSRIEGNEVKRKGQQEVVASRSTGEGGEPNPRDPLEGRGCRIKKPLEGNMTNSPKFADVYTKQERIANLARRVSKTAIKSLNHYLDRDWLIAAYSLVNKRSAVGVDGVTSVAFESELSINVDILIDLAKSGQYKAPPVKRAWIPKNKSQLRPIGLPSFGDKVLQRAVVMLLEPIFEQDFLDVSYGFRPSRSCHQAVGKIREEVMSMKGATLIEADIRGFFDEMSHTHLRSFLRERIGDGVILRLIDKWLKAGVMSEGTLHRTEKGSVQGGIISPLLSNLYLHHVLDTWFVEQVQPRLKGRSFLVRYCDDFVMGFEFEEDAQRVFSVLGHRFKKFELELHETKTRLVPFRRPAWGSHKADKALTTTFDFLGFTFLWGQSRRRNWVVKMKTAKDRLARSLAQINEWARRNRHQPVRDLMKSFWRKIVGHANYYGLPGNSAAVHEFQYRALETLRKWLCRRSNDGYFTLDRMKRLLARFPRPKMHTQFLDPGLAKS
jgi:RNA-directed DNA polymerase